MIIKRGLALLTFVFLFALFSFSFVSAVGVSVSETNSTHAVVSISSASNLYAYEVNLDYTGSIDSVAFNGFLGSGTSSGNTQRNSITSIYESRLDSTQTGVSGSGSLFNITHTGDLSLRYAVFVSSTGSTETVYYNGSSSTNSSTSSTSSTTTSSGATGTGVDVENIKLSVAEQDLTFTLISGSTEKKTIRVKNIGTQRAIFVIEPKNLEGLLLLSPAFSLDAGEEKEIELVFSSSGRKLIVGTLEIKTSGVSVYSLPVVINLRSENFLFDAGIFISNNYKEVSSGEIIPVQVNLQQVGPKEKVDVVVTYTVKDFSGKTYFEESETFFVLENKDFVKEVSTFGLLPGKYVLSMEVVYPGAFATSSTQFEVADSRVLKKSELVYVVIVAMVLILIGLGYWLFHRSYSKKNKHRRV